MKDINYGNMEIFINLINEIYKNKSENRNIIVF